MTTKHTNLKNQTLVILSKKCIVWANETGVARSITGDRVITFGKKGSPDIIGWIKSTGIFIGVEIKVPPDTMKYDQIIFKDVCEKNNAKYYIVRSVEDAEKILDTF